MNNYTTQSPFPKSASAWLARLRAQEISKETNLAFEEWLDADPKNEIEYEHCEMIAEMAQDLRDDPDLTPFLEECKRDVVDYNKNKDRAGMLKKRGMQVMASLTTIAAAVAVIFFSFQPEVFETKVGEQRTVMLEDNSLIRLNTNTKVFVEYSSGERLITLGYGEATFEVTPDKKRPFRVLAAKGSAVALGTIFNVKIDNGKVTVAVIEGEVRVAGSQLTDTSSSLPVLTVSEAISYQNNLIDSEKHEADIKRIIGWREGKLVFDNLQLSKAIEEHNRYTTHHIRLGDSQLSDLTISGVFKVGDTKSLLFLLKNTLNLKVVSDQNGIILYLKDDDVALQRILSEELVAGFEPSL